MAWIRQFYTRGDLGDLHEEEGEEEDRGPLWKDDHEEEGEVEEDKGPLWKGGPRGGEGRGPTLKEGGRGEGEKWVGIGGVVDKEEEEL